MTQQTNPVKDRLADLLSLLNKGNSDGSATSIESLRTIGGELMAFRSWAVNSVMQLQQQLRGLTEHLSQQLIGVDARLRELEELASSDGGLDPDDAQLLLTVVVSCEMLVSAQLEAVQKEPDSEPKKKAVAKFNELLALCDQGKAILEDFGGDEDDDEDDQEPSGGS